MSDNVTSARSPEASTSTFDGSAASSVNTPGAPVRKPKSPSPPTYWLAKHNSVAQTPQQAEQYKPSISVANATTIPDSPPFVGEASSSSANITVVRDPKNPLGKNVTRNPDGTISKQSSVNVSFGTAITYQVDTHAELAKLLKEVGEDPHAAIINAAFHGIPIGEEFLILSEREIEQQLGIPQNSRERQKGIHAIEYNGRIYKAVGRFKENVSPSIWQYLDRDIDEHTPDQYRTLTVPELIAKLAEIIPGLADLSYCHIGSSSARVLCDGKPIGGGNGHVWFKVRNPADIERFRTALLIAAAEAKMTWMKPRYSRSESGTIVGHSLTTVYDPSVFTQGRLTFIGKPVVSGSLTVEPLTASIHIGTQNTLNTEQVILPEKQSVREITRKAGVTMNVSSSSNGLRITADDLTLGTEIETENQGTMSVRELLKQGIPGKIRCQTPFRESSSFAAFLSTNPEGKPFVYDVGTGITHWLNEFEEVTPKPQESSTDIIVCDNAVEPIQENLDPLTAMQRRYALINLGGKLCVLDGASLNERTDQGAAKALVVYDRKDGGLLMRRYLRAIYPYSNADEIVGEFFINPQTLCYDGVDFNPKGTSDQYLNLWVGPTITPKKGQWKKIRSFLLDIICNGDMKAYRYLLMYLAHALQHPEEKPGVMIVLIGGQGVGKGTLGSIIQKIWGATFVPVNSIDKVIGNFNAILERALFVFMDEALFFGNRRGSDELKSLVTERTILISEKYQPSRQISSFHRFIAATNADHFKNTERDDRRDFTLRVSESRKGDHEYWKELNHEINNGGTEALAFDLLEMDLSEFNVRDKPNTAELLEQKMHSLDHTGRWWYDCLDRGYIDASGKWQEFLSTADAIAGIVDVAGGRIHQKPAALNVLRAMQRLCPSAKSIQKQTKFDRHRGLSLPSLQQARIEFEIYIGGQLEWPED